MDPQSMQIEIGAIIARVPTESARARLADELKILISRWNAPTATAEEKSAVEARLAQLRRDAEIAAQVSLWSTWSFALVGAVLVAFVGGIFLYLRGMLPQPYWTIEATRPVIVFTLLLAVMGFGGLLIARALFSNEADERLQNRFRLAREVFLVYSSVFGTVIGFYFGASSGTAVEPPTVAGITVGSDGTVVAIVSKGRAPFTGRIRLMSGDDLALAPAAIENQLSVHLNPTRDCPAGATVTVTDGDRHQAERKVEENATLLLQRGWAACAGQAGSGGNASGNNVQ